MDDRRSQCAPRPKSKHGASARQALAATARPHTFSVSKCDAHKQELAADDPAPRVWKGNDLADRAAKAALARRPPHDRAA